MLRYDRQTKPGLVALYDIWPGNGAGLFLQPWSPYGVHFVRLCETAYDDIINSQLIETFCY